MLDSPRPLHFPRNFVTEEGTVEEIHGRLTWHPFDCKACRANGTSSGSSFSSLCHWFGEGFFSSRSFSTLKEAHISASLLRLCWNISKKSSSALNAPSSIATLNFQVISDRKSFSSCACPSTPCRESPNRDYWHYTQTEGSDGAAVFAKHWWACTGRQNLVLRLSRKCQTETIFK